MNEKDNMQIVVAMEKLKTYCSPEKMMVADNTDPIVGASMPQDHCRGKTSEIPRLGSRTDSASYSSIT